MNKIKGLADPWSEMANYPATRSVFTSLINTAAASAQLHTHVLTQPFFLLLCSL